MSVPITTKGTTTDPVSTQRMGGELLSAWVTRHSTAVQAATLNGNKLVTSWKSAGGMEETPTTRNPGESDDDFLQRHVLEYLAAMIDYPPE